MSDDIKAVHREPHPFIGLNHIAHFVGRPVAFVGKVDRIEDNILYLKTAEGKSNFLIFVGWNDIIHKNALNINFATISKRGLH